MEPEQWWEGFCIKDKIIGDIGKKTTGLSLDEMSICLLYKECISTENDVHSKNYASEATNMQYSACYKFSMEYLLQIKCTRYI